MKIKAIDGSKQIYDESGTLNPSETNSAEINFETERGVSAEGYNSNNIKTVKPTEATIFFEEGLYNKDDKQKYLINDVISKNKKMSYAAVKNIEGNLTAAGIEDVIQDNYTKADSGVFVYNGLSSEQYQEEIADGATKSTEGAVVIKKASGSKPEELKREEYSIFSDTKEKASDNSYYNKGINANSYAGILEKEDGKYWNQVGQQIKNSFKNSISNYVKPWEEYNFFSKSFWEGTAKSETTRTANAFGKIRTLREQEEYELQYNWGDKSTDDNSFKLQYIPLNEQLSGFTTRSLNPSVNVVGSMNADLRGPLASPSYISSIETNKTDSQFKKFGIASANAGIGIANQFINNLGLSSTAELTSGLIRGVSSDDFLEGFGDAVTSVSMTASEVLQLNAATAQNFYTSKPGTYIKYGKASHNEIANIHMFPSTPNRGDYESSYKKLNISSVRLEQMTRLGTYGFLRDLMSSNPDGIPFFANDENFRFNSTTNSWTTESVTTNQTLFGVSSDSSSSEVADMIARLISKNNSYKELGRIYIKINPTLGIEEPLEIPFEFTPIINENANVAKYQSESLLGRIGAWHMYTGTDLGGITLTTTYIPLASDSLDEREEVNKKKQFGLDEWQYYWTTNRINQIELKYRSLVLPTYGKDLIKPPIIQIELGEKNSNSLDNFFKHPVGGLKQSEEKGVLTYSDEAKKYLKYTKYFNDGSEDAGYKRIRKSYVVTSCQFLPISEEGYYNMYGAFRSNYNKSLSTALEQKNRSFHMVDDNNGEDWQYGVASRGFKVTIQCLEVKENIMDLYPDFKYYCDSIKSLKTFTAEPPSTNKLTVEQIKAIANMGINYLGSNSQTQLKMLLDNILKRFRAKKVAEGIEENVWKISKFFYNNEPSFYKNFGTTENEKNGDNYGYELGNGESIGSRRVLDFKNDSAVFRSFNDFASQKTDNKKTLKQLMKPSGMNDEEYENFFRSSSDVELIPNNENKFFSSEKESDIKAKYAVNGIGSKVRGGSGKGCIVYELDGKDDELKGFFEKAKNDLSKIKEYIEEELPDFKDSYSESDIFMDDLTKRVAENEVDKILIKIEAINKYNPKEPAEGEDIKDQILDQIKEYEENLGIERTSLDSLASLGELLRKEKQGSGEFIMEGVTGHFKNTKNRKTSAKQVIDTALKTVENNIDILNNKGNKAFQTISISGETAIFTNMLSPIKVSFQKTFKNNSDESFTKKYLMTLKIGVGEIKTYKASVLNISDKIYSTYKSLIESSKLAVIKYLQEEVYSKDKKLKKEMEDIGEDVVTIINKLNNNSTIEEIDGVIQTLQSFCNPDEANKQIVDTLGGTCGNETFNNYEAATPNWGNSNTSSDVNILASYTLSDKNVLNSNDIKYNKDTETFQSKSGNKDIDADTWGKLKEAIASGTGNSSTKPTIYNVVETIHSEQLEIERLGRLQGLNIK